MRVPDGQFNRTIHPTTWQDVRNYLVFIQEVLPKWLEDSLHMLERNMVSTRLCAIPLGEVCKWPFRPDIWKKIDFEWRYLRISSSQDNLIYHLLNIFSAVPWRVTVYCSPVNSEINLVARISIAAASISETPGIFENVRQSMLRKFNACVLANGRNFEPLLWFL